MNLTIFTPALRTSAIGRMTRLVVGALIAQGHQVVVVRSEDKQFLAEPTHEFGVELVNWNDAPNVEAVIRRTDMLVYQVGNNYAFHRGCMQWMESHPGIVCLHDFFLGHLFYEWAHSRRIVATAVLHAWYGAEVAKSYFHDEGDFIERTWEVAPMTEWISSMALGVVTHSSWAIDRVLKACPGPVSVLALPYDAQAGVGHDFLDGQAAEQKRIRILTIGHINPNKRVESVIQAISLSPFLRENVCYQLAGKIEDAAKVEIRELSAALRVDVEIWGEVDDKTLREAISSADVMCCLRSPTLEAASASAIESMLYGKATVVMDTGFYAELPDACVRKISVEQELSDLTFTLEELCRDPKLRISLGNAAAKWATETFEADKYAHGLVELCDNVSKASPTLAICRSYSEMLLKWGGLQDKAANLHIIGPLGVFSWAD